MRGWKPRLFFSFSYPICVVSCRKLSDILHLIHIRLEFVVKGSYLWDRLPSSWFGGWALFSYYPDRHSLPLIFCHIGLPNSVYVQSISVLCSSVNCLQHVPQNYELSYCTLGMSQYIDKPLELSETFVGVYPTFCMRGSWIQRSQPASLGKK